MSREFVRAQHERAHHAVDGAFAEPVAAPLAEPFPRASWRWLRRFALIVVLIVHGWLRRVVELPRDLSGVGTMRTWVVEIAQRAVQINPAQDPPGVALRASARNLRCRRLAT